MDYNISRNLLLSKNFFDNACMLMDTEGSLNYMLAIHNFHISVEITLKAILKEYNIKSKGAENLYQIIELIKSIKDKSLPLEQDIKILNQNRNLIQHSAQEPSRQQVYKSKQDTLSFLESVFENYFNINFNDLSDTLYISDKMLKECINKAIEFEIDNIEKALALLTCAFEYAVYSLDNKISRTVPGLSDGMEKNIYNRIYKSERLSVILSSGISFSDYYIYHKFTPFCDLFLDSMDIPTLNEENDLVFKLRLNAVDITKDDYNKIKNFVISSIVRWQNIGMSPTVENEYVTKGMNSFINYIINSKVGKEYKLV